MSAMQKSVNSKFCPYALASVVFWRGRKTCHTGAAAHESRWLEYNRQPCKITRLMPESCSCCEPCLSHVRGPETSLVVQKMSKAFLWVFQFSWCKLLLWPSGAGTSITKPHKIMPDPSNNIPAEGTHRKHPELWKKLKVTQPHKTQAE